MTSIIALKMRTAAASIAVAGLVLAAGYLGRHEAVAVPRAAPSRTVIERRVEVVRARNRIDPGFGCALIPEGSREVVLLLTTRAARARAEQVAAEFPAGAVEVGDTSARMTRKRIHRIQRVAEQTAPRAGQYGIGLGLTFGVRSCPVVEVMIPPRRFGRVREERWAAKLVKRFGRDRVKVRRGIATED